MSHNIYYGMPRVVLILDLGVLASHPKVFGAENVSICVTR
jgi:hypothetical protein